MLISVRTPSNRIFDVSHIRDVSTLLCNLETEYEDMVIDIPISVFETDGFVFNSTDPTDVKHVDLCTEKAIQALELLSSLCQNIDTFNNNTGNSKTHIEWGELKRTIEEKEDSLETLLDDDECVYNWLSPLETLETTFTTYDNYNDIASRYDPDTGLSSQFRQACYKGDLKLAKWIYQLGVRSGIDIYNHQQLAFTRAVSNGHLETAKWLYSLGGFDIRIDNDMPFRSACSGGYLDMAKWLYSLGSNVHAKNEESIGSACYEGHIDTVKWLVSIGADVHFHDEGPFREACAGGNLELAKWIYSLGITNEHISKGSWVYKVANSNGDSHVVDWLNQL